MGKNKVNFITKIFLITILIILTTLGSSYSVNAGTPIKTDADFIDAKTSATPKPNLANDVANDNVGIHNLDSDADPTVLCSAQGVQLSDKYANNGTDYDNPEDYAAYTKNRYVGTGFGCTPMEVFILAHTSDYIGTTSHYARGTQWAWWAHLSGAINTYTLSSDVDNTSAWTNADVASLANILNRASADSANLESLLNNLNYSSMGLNASASVVAQEVQSIYDACEYKNIMFFFNGVRKSTILSENDKKAIVRAILVELHEEVTDEMIEYALNGEKSNNEHKSYEYTLTEQAGLFQAYVDKFLSDGKLKDEYKPELVSKDIEVNSADGSGKEVKNFSVTYNTETQCFVLGPLKMIYPDAELFAGLTEVNLSTDNGDLVAVNVDNINDLNLNEYTFINADNGSLIENYPDHNVPFYIYARVDKETTTFKGYNFKCKYLLYNGDASYIWYEGSSKEFTDWTTTFNYTIYYYTGVYDDDGNEKRSSKSGTTTIVTKGNEACDPPSFSEMRQKAIQDSGISASKVYNVTLNTVDVQGSYEEKVSQTLSQIDTEARLWYEEGGDGIDFPSGPDTFTLTKKTVSVNDEDVSSYTNDVFYFDILLNGKKYTEVSLLPNESKQVKTPAYYGDKPKVTIIEKDHMGRYYEDYVNNNINDDESIWDRFTPKNGGVHELEDSEFEVVYENVAREKHGHLIIEKRVKSETDKTVFNIGVDLIYKSRVDAGKTQTRIIKKLSPNGENEEGVKTGVDAEGYHYARYEFEPIVWNGDLNPEYQVYELDDDLKSYEEDPENPFWNMYESNIESGTIEKCSVKDVDHDVDDLKDIVSKAKITNEIQEPTKIEIDLKKLLKDKDNKIIPVENTYSINVDLYRQNPNVNDGKKEKEQGQTVEIISNNDKYENVMFDLGYSVKEGDRFFIRIYELNNQTDSNLTDVIDVMEDDEDLVTDDKQFTEVTNNMLNGNDGRWDYDENGKYFEQEVVVESHQHVKLRTAAFNTKDVNYTAIRVEKQIAAPTSDAYYFSITAHGSEKDYVDFSEVLFADYIYKPNGDSVKTTAGNQVVEIKKNSDNKFVLDSKIIEFPSETPYATITEVDQHGNTYREFKAAEKQGTENKDSIWVKAKPSASNPEGIIAKPFESFESESQVKFDKAVMVIQNEATVRIKVLKKVVDPDGNDITEEYFTKLNPSAKFKFMVFAYKAWNITEECFGTNYIEINKDNYKNGVLSFDIDTSKYGSQFTLVEVFDTQEEANLYNSEEMIKAKVFNIEDSETTEVTIEGENVAGKKIIVDKSISDFLDGEEFYFRVFELVGKKETDMTKEWFGTDKITVDLTAHNNNGISSIDYIYGNRTIVVKEYDDKDFLWEDRAKSSSDYWTKYRPSNDGVWTSTLDSYVGPALVEAENYRNTDVKLIKKYSGNYDELSNEEKEQKFTIKVSIDPNDATKLKIDGKDITEKTTKTFELKINKEDSIDNITWSEGTPKLSIIETNLPSSWKLKGFKINGAELVEGESYEIDLKPGVDIEAVIENEIDNRGKIKVTKTLVDQMGNATSVKEDTTFLFDIYLAGTGVSYDGYTQEELSIPTDKDGMERAFEAKNPVATLEVFMNDGQVQEVSSKDIAYAAGSTLYYKVVETDAKGYTYDEYVADRKNLKEGKELKYFESEEEFNESLWKKYGPVSFSSNNNMKNTNGIWDGEISKKESSISVEANNKVTEAKIDLTKTVYDETGKIVDLEGEEKFFYDMTVTSSERGLLETINDIEITADSPIYTEVIELIDDEEITIVAQEQENYINAYGEERKVEDDFTMANGGKVEKVIDKDTVETDMSVSMKGENLKKLKAKLALVKRFEGKDDFEVGEEFFFKVEGYETEESLKELFPEAKQIKTLSNGTVAVVLYRYENDEQRTVVSAEKEWNYREDKPVFKITEVDLNGEEFDKEKHDNKEYSDESIWSKCTPLDGGKTTVVLQPNDTQNINSAIITNHFDEHYNFSLKKEVRKGNSDATPDVIKVQSFYFEIFDGTGTKMLNIDELNKLFPEYTTSIKYLPENNEVPVVEINSSNYVDGVTSRNVLKDENYVIVEVDQFGDEYSTTPKEGSLWNIYHPEGDGRWFASATQDKVVATNGIFEYEANLTLKKVTTYEWTNGQTYTIKVFRADPDKKGGFGDEYEIANVELTVDHDSEPLEPIKWNSLEGAPRIRFEEQGDYPNAKYYVNSKEVGRNSSFQLYNKDKYEYSLVCENGSKSHEGNIIIKKATNWESGDKEFVFYYQYSKDEGTTWTDPVRMTLKKNESKNTENIKWLDGESTPMFRVWELNGSDYNVSWEAENVENCVIAKENVPTGEETTVKGHVTENVTDKKPTVKLIATNKEDDHYGYLRVLKDFEILEAKEGVTFDELKQELLKIDQDAKFTFNVVLTSENGFNYYYGSVSGTANKNSQGKFEASLTETKKLSELSEKDNNIFGDIKVTWKGDSVPRFEVTESNSGNFWTGVISESGSVTLKVDVDDPSVVRINNGYSVKPSARLLIHFGGTTWEDHYEKDKVELEERGNNSKLDDQDTLLSGIIVKPVRLISKQNDSGNYEVISKQYNSEYKFIRNFDSDFVKTGTNGKWAIQDVYVPAFDLDNPTEKDYYEKGYYVRYDFEFYYDGITYEPVEFLEASSGNALKYMQDVINNASDLDKYYVDSHADEITDTRNAYNDKFATVIGNTLTDENGNASGKLVGVDENGNAVSTDINYKETMAAASGDITRVRVEGTVDLGDGTNTEKLMMASTAQLTKGQGGKSYYNPNKGLVYIFGEATSLNPAYFTEEFGARRRIVTPDGVVYETGKVLNEGAYPYMENINLGLLRREQAQNIATKHIQSATIIINDKTKTYAFDVNQKPEDSLSAIVKELDNDDEITKLILADSRENGVGYADFNIYTSDYQYRTSVYEGTEVYNAFNTFYSAIAGATGDAVKSKELKVYLTYSVEILNRSIYDVEINSIKDYSAKDLEYVDLASGYNYATGDSTNTKGPGLYAYIEQDKVEETEMLNVLDPSVSSITWSNKYYDPDKTVSNNEIINKVKDLTEDYSEMTIGKKFRLEPNGKKILYLTYKVNNINELSESLFELGEKRNYVEVGSYTTYIAGTDKHAAAIDEASAPADFNIKSHPNVLEFDTDVAVANIKTSDSIQRTISGKTWYDTNSNGIVDDEDNMISNVTTQLVEIIDLPIRDGAYNTDGNYTEYEFNWVGSETVSSDDGSYKVDTMDIDGVTSKGLIPGNYVTRFVYGDKEGTYVDGKHINGEDFKTTRYTDAYENTSDKFVDNEWLDVENRSDKQQNEARDNEARRLQLIADNYELNNKNTSIYKVANYNTKADYINAYTENGKSTKHPGMTASQVEEKYDEYKDALYQPLKYTANGTRIANEGIISQTFGSTTMFADTAKMNLKTELHDADAMGEDSNKQKGYDVSGINFGVEERSKTKIFLDKQIKEIKVTENNSQNSYYINYDIDYDTVEIEEGKESEATAKENNLIAAGYKLVDKSDDQIHLYVKISTENVANTMLAMDDQLDSDDKVVQGFRYICVDEDKINGLTLDIKYQISAFNFSELDYYSEELNRLYTEVTSDKFQDEMAKLIADRASSSYTLVNKVLDYDNDNSPKKYGVTVGNYYYNAENAEQAVVGTAVRKVVDYIDNNTGVDLNVVQQDQRWAVISTSEQDKLKDYIDNETYVNGVIENETEVPVKNILICADNGLGNVEGNNSLVEYITPLATNGKIEDSMVTTEVSTVKKFNSADNNSDTAIDNMAEILVYTNGVGRRDETTTCGTYDQRLGATGIVERDEASTESISIAPPPGNAENERHLTTALIIITLIALTSGATAGIKIKFGKKSNKKSKK